MTTTVPNPETKFELANGVPTPEAIDKFPPQAQEIIKLIIAAGGSITKFDLLNEMVKVVKTGQPIQRILTFYQSRLVKSGVVNVIAPEKPAKKTAEEKAAEKEAKAEAKKAAIAAKNAEKAAAKDAAAKAKAEALAAKKAAKTVEVKVEATV